MFKCHEACKLLSGAQDRKLTPHERLSLKLHLSACIRCHRYCKQLAFLRVNLKKWQQRLPQCRSIRGGRTEMAGPSFSDGLYNFGVVQDFTWRSAVIEGGLIGPSFPFTEGGGGPFVSGHPRRRLFSQWPHLPIY